jgi:hypothetical protein
MTGGDIQKMIWIKNNVCPCEYTRYLSYKLADSIRDIEHSKWLDKKTKR